MKSSKRENDSESVVGESVSDSRESSDSRSSCGDSCSSVQLASPVKKKITNCLNSIGKSKSHLNGDDDELKLKNGLKGCTEPDMMKERFAKLLLGEDMSGSGKGVSSALTISNAITNLCASVFGQLWRLEPLPSEKKAMWQREMECLVCVSDHIVEMIPSWQTFPNGNRVEVMTCQPRSDLTINLPALHKLDNMLLEILDGFTVAGFWYVDQGIVTPEADGSVSFQRASKRQADKWWLPVPRVPPGGLPENERKKLHHKRDCANQILKAATAINAIALAEMEVPESYMETLPKNGRACLGDIIYRYMTSDHFSVECLLDCLDLSSDHAALEIANRVEAAIYMWRGRHHQLHPPSHPTHSSKSSWGIVRDLVLHVDKRELLSQRAETLLLSLKQRFPGLPQTALDTTKIQCNKDVGKSILESYSRVLESLAFNIMARIEDLLFVDDITKQSSGKLSSVSLGSCKKVPVPYTAPASGTPYRSAYTTPSFSPARALSPGRGDRTPGQSGSSNKSGRRGLGVRRALTNYLGGGDAKVKSFEHVVDGAGLISNIMTEKENADSERGREKHNLALVMSVGENK